MVRTGQLDLENIVGESLVDVLNVSGTRSWDTHGLGSLKSYQHITEIQNAKHVPGQRHGQTHHYQTCPPPKLSRTT